VTRDGAWKLAEHWIADWNAHDLDLILAHYEDAIELPSPVAAQLLGMADGKVIGKANLKAYFRRGLEAYPGLKNGKSDMLFPAPKLPVTRLTGTLAMFGVYTSYVFHVLS
jgi:hypothetical protein